MPLWLFWLLGKEKGDTGGDERGHWVKIEAAKVVVRNDAVGTEQEIGACEMSGDEMSDESRWGMVLEL